MCGVRVFICLKMSVPDSQYHTITTMIKNSGNFVNWVKKEMNSNETVSLMWGESKEQKDAVTNQQVFSFENL